MEPFKIIDTTIATFSKAGETDLNRIKPGESIWKPGEYLLESELMRFATEHRQVIF